MSKHIFWITSYPKSGNTLLRAIISSLFFTNDGKFNFNLLKTINTFENKRRLDFIKTINPKDFNSLNKLEILSKYWNKIQSKSNLNFKENMIFIKTHHALVKYEKIPFAVEEDCRGLMHVVRDPRDVVISWANHAKISIDKSIDYLTNEFSGTHWNNHRSSLLPKDIEPLTILSSWEKNIKSWTESKWKCPQLILRYEDLVYDKRNSILLIANFFIEKFNFKFSNLDKKIDNIIKTTNFSELKKIEKNKGFSEARNGPFFRVGKKNQWKKVLNKNQIEIIENKFKSTMTEFGYKKNI